MGESKVSQLRAKSDEVLLAKGRDYTKGSLDRCANFRMSATDAGITPLQVWLVFIGKHNAAMLSYVKTNGQSESEPIFMRFVDLFNYTKLGWLLASQDERLYEDWSPAFSCDDFGLVNTALGPEDLSLVSDLKDAATDASVSLTSAWVSAYVAQYKQVARLTRGGSRLLNQSLALADFARLLRLIETGWVIVSENFAKE
jgi:hypothetical protein